ncbi:MAG: WXG100 family type VII secretion target [Acidimicrobiia bacterium]
MIRRCGDPDAFEELAEYFAGTAANAQEACSRLRRLADGVDDAIWKDEAADVFRDDVGKLPGHLDKLYESYDLASQGLRTYGSRWCWRLLRA